MSHHKRRGLSMPELMVAMTVLFVVCTFIMGMFVTGLRQTAQATQHQDLEMLTRRKLSELRAMEFSQLDSQATTGRFDSPNDRFHYEIAYSPVPNEDLSDVRVVEVTVTHPEFGSRSGKTVRSNVQVESGRAAWEKFDCGSCHSLPAAGYDDPTLLPLGPIPVNDPNNPRPIGPGGVDAYISDSIRNPSDFVAYDPAEEGVMQDFFIEGDPQYDPNSTDQFTAANSMSNEEVQALTEWIGGFQ